MLKLTRTISNRTCTIGHLTSDDGTLDIITKEGRLPISRENYTGWLLPPGDYLLNVEQAPLEINGITIRGYWASFQKVPWFPYAGFYTNTRMLVSKGRIVIASAMVDEFTVEDPYIEAQKQFIRFCKRWYDNHPNEPLPLTIIQDEATMEVHDYDDRQFVEIDKERKIEEAREKLMKEIFSPPASPPAP